MSCCYAGLELSSGASLFAGGNLDLTSTNATLLMGSNLTVAGAVVNAAEINMYNQALVLVGGALTLCHERRRLEDT